MRALALVFVLPSLLAAADPAATEAAAEELWARGQYVLSVVEGLAKSKEVSERDAALLAEALDPAKKRLRLEFVFDELGDLVVVEADAKKITAFVARADLKEIANGLGDPGAHGVAMNREALKALCHAQGLDALVDKVGYAPLAEDLFQEWLKKHGKDLEMPKYFYQAP
ncbi:hypothetical protein K2X33_08675 [bacterium]|nr:hypothetical protein [bacterium]